MLDKEKHKHILAYFAQFIESELGIVYSDFNDFQLMRRLEEISTLMNCANVEDLYQRAKNGMHGDFKTLVLDSSTNNETSFFRDTRAFDVLTKSILPPLIEKSKTKPIHIWSAACSSGQEPLSLAILLKEHELQTGQKINFRITATDISERILQKAEAGVYTQLEVQRGLPARYLIKYFRQTGDQKWKANETLLSCIDYKKVNLKSNCQFAQLFDLVLCRNMLIYQKVDSKKQIVKKLLDSMNVQGFLLLGAGESLLGIDSSCVAQSQDGSIYYVKPKTERAAG